MTLRDIVILNDFAHVNGGAALAALHGAIGLARRGHRVTVLAAVGPAWPELSAQGVRVICTGQHEILRDPSRVRAAVQGLWNVRAAALLRRTLGPMDPASTVVHVHGWSKALSVSPVRAATSAGFPVVCTLHDYFAACPNGGFYDYRAGRACQLRAMSVRCLACHCDSRNFGHKLWRVGRQWVQRGLGGLPGRIGHFVAVSEFSLAILRPYLPSAAACYLVENPIAAERRPPADVGANRSFLFVGRLSPEKGPLLLAEAVRSGGSAGGHEVVFVGDGPCRSQVAAACPSATVTGWVSNADVYAHLRRARALVLPSLWHETQGIAVLEAASCGVPAIVPGSSAAAEFVENGRTGLHFAGGDAGELRGQIDRLGDARLACRLGQNAYDKYWARPFTLDRHLTGLEQVYRRMVGG